MSPNPRGPILLRLAILFFVPLLGAIFLFVPRGDGIGLAFISYGLLLLGLSFYAAAAITTGTLTRILLGVGLVVGTLLLHIAVGVGGCTIVLAVAS
jgi:hypothetical protein